MKDPLSVEPQKPDYGPHDIEDGYDTRFLQPDWNGFGALQNQPGIANNPSEAAHLSERHELHSNFQQTYNGQYPFYQNPHNSRINFNQPGLPQNGFQGEGERIKQESLFNSNAGSHFSGNMEEQVGFLGNTTDKGNSTKAKENGNYSPRDPTHNLQEGQQAGIYPYPNYPTNYLNRGNTFSNGNFLVNSPHNPVQWPGYNQEAVANRKPNNPQMFDPRIYNANLFIPKPSLQEPYKYFQNPMNRIGGEISFR